MTIRQHHKEKIAILSEDVAYASKKVEAGEWEPFLLELPQRRLEEAVAKWAHIQEGGYCFR